MNKILVEVSVGELFDKISILEIKKDKIKDEEKLKYIVDEYNLLKEQMVDKVKLNEKLSGLFGALKAVSYTHLRAHETGRNLVCRLLLEKK